MAERLDDPRAALARRMRSEEALSGEQIQDRLGVSKRVLQVWLRGIPPPARAVPPTAKDGTRSRACDLRQEGWSVNDIAVELGIAKSTAWLWVKHLPLDRDSERALYKRTRAKLMTDAQWAARRQARDDSRAAIQATAERQVGALSERETLLLGAAIYWCEGAKEKPWRPNEARLVFTNSDAVLVDMFLRFMQLLGRGRDSLTYCVSIHETADAVAAQAWWAERLALPLSRFQKAALKRHRPGTNRHNTGDGYHGCLVVRVPRGRELYWTIEGMMRGLAGAADTGVGIT